MIAVVGGGIAGTSLVKILEEKNLEFVWIIDKVPSASHISSGIINPISGRRYALAWEFEKFKSYSISFYQNFIRKISIHKFYHPYSDEYDLEKDLKGKDDYIQKLNENWLEVKDAYQVRVPEFIEYWIEKLTTKNKILFEKFDHQILNYTDEKLSYKDLIFDQIIFAEGINALSNPFFNHIHFIPNRGEALTFQSSSFKADPVIHDGKFICNFQDKLWVGSSFERIGINEPNTSATEYIKLEDAIKKITKTSDYSIINHLGAFRATTYDRRPYIGQHKAIKSMFIFNGFGTKGASLAPFYAHQLIHHIFENKALDAEVDIKRLKL